MSTSPTSTRRTALPGLRCRRLHVLIIDDATAVGRFNLIFEGSGSAMLGYRVAERVAGQGSRRRPSDACKSAPTPTTKSGLPRAATSHASTASQKVLQRRARTCRARRPR